LRYGGPGVHSHRWAPAGQGNDAVLVAIDASKVVRFDGPAHPTKAASAVAAQPRLLVLKSPMMTGNDVLAVQRALNQRENAGLDTDSTYRPATRDAVIKWQQRAHLGVDGIVGPQTRSSLGLPS
jgi:peptidoglycan hydrolase-like protein with peptidoglycan-binding domain